MTMQYIDYMPRKIAKKKMTHTLRKRRKQPACLYAERRSMDNKLKFNNWNVISWLPMSKEKLNKEQYFDLDKLPGNQLQTEFVEYIYYVERRYPSLTIKKGKALFLTAYVNFSEVIPSGEQPA